MALNGNHSAGDPTHTSDHNLIDNALLTKVGPWTTNTAYALGQSVLNPNGELVKAVAAFTSGASYSAANWSTPPSGTYAPLVSPALTGSPTINGTAAETTTGAQTKATAAQTAAAAAAATAKTTADSTYVTIVEHGATAGTARPAGAVRVFWRGTVAPTNAVIWDRWLDMSTAGAPIEKVVTSVGPQVFITLGGISQSAGDARYEALGISSGTLTTLDSRYIAAGNAIGSRLATASLATGVTLSSLGTTLTDITGLAISPVIGSRGVDIDVCLPVYQADTANSLVIAVIDVTAGNVQVGQLVAPIVANFSAPIFLKVPVAPAAGTRTYKVQAKLTGGTANISFSGQDVGATKSFIACTQR